jgi:hypothetical protein
MRRFVLAFPTALLTLAFALAPAAGADDAKVKAATKQVERGASKIGGGVEETAKGIGNTVVEGSKFTGEKLKESGKAAEPGAKSAWQNVKEGATNFGHSVKSFFGRLFGS